MNALYLVSSVMMTGDASGGTNGTKGLGEVLTQAGKTATVWAGYAIIIVGVLLIFWSFWMIGQKFMGGQQAQHQNSWVKIACCLILGGCAAFGGMGFALDMASIGQKSASDLSGIDVSGSETTTITGAQGNQQNAVGS